MQRMKHLSAIAALGALAVAGLLVSPAAAARSSATVFDSIPSTLPGNVPSLAFESTSTSEFGDYARFAGNKRSLQKVTVVMSSWGCESGAAGAGGNCVTTPGATFNHDITLNLYTNPGSGQVGSEITSKTQTFAIPYRPSADPSCSDGKWLDGNGTCYNGLATTITFTFSGVTLPASVIYGIAYNTTSYGYDPIGQSAPCFSEPGGCGYDSLNVSAASATPRVGVDADENGVFLNSSWTGAYCDNGTSGTGTFRLDSPCWTVNNPMIKFTARR